MRHQLQASLFLAAAALAAAPLAGCAGVPYRWIDDLPPQGPAEEGVIGPGDLLGVRVFNQDGMSARARVRGDGKIALPFLGDVEVRGKTPGALSKELAVRLKEFVVSPVVTVSVEETQPAAVAVLGEVAKPGSYVLDPTPGVMQALAAAGGFTEYANREGIYVVRHGSAPRIRFTFGALEQGEGRAAAFRLHAGDVVVVE
jgi:polysaccharide export outer membrane protein